MKIFGITSIVECFKRGEIELFKTNSFVGHIMLVNDFTLIHKIA